MQNGFDRVAILSGGTTFYKSMHYKQTTIKKDDNTTNNASTSSHSIKLALWLNIFSATNPNILTGSLAKENGGAYGIYGRYCFLV